MLLRLQTFFKSKLLSTGLLTINQTSQVVELVCYAHIPHSSFFHPLPSQTSHLIYVSSKKALYCVVALLSLRCNRLSNERLCVHPRTPHQAASLGNSESTREESQTLDVSRNCQLCGSKIAVAILLILGCFHWVFEIDEGAFFSSCEFTSPSHASEPKLRGGILPFFKLYFNCVTGLSNSV